jgi:hypothetical protein
MHGGDAPQIVDCLVLEAETQRCVRTVEQKLLAREYEWKPQRSVVNLCVINFLPAHTAID